MTQPTSILSRPEIRTYGTVHGVSLAMKITVLVDNTTLTDHYYSGEPGLSLHIEDDETKILFDCGYSDLVVRNATAMGIDLCSLDYVVLSHGHLDHSWGLLPLVRLLTEAAIERRPHKRPILVAHPHALAHRSDDEIPAAGSILSRRALQTVLAIEETTQPRWLTPRLAFLGEIPRVGESSAQTGVSHARIEAGPCGELVDDRWLDDTGLAYKAADGIIVLTGCAHAGVCNIVRQAQAVCGTKAVRDIVGGFHLLGESEVRLQEISYELAEFQPQCIHPCHCTDLAAKVALARKLKVHDVGVGLQLEYGPSRRAVITSTNI